MKVEKRFCDFCATEVKKGDTLASFSVPSSVAAQIDGTLPKPQTARVTDESGHTFLGQIYFTLSGYGDGSQSYDVCLGCARSLLAARFASVKRAHAVAAAAMPPVAVQADDNDDDDGDEEED